MRTAILLQLVLAITGCTSIPQGIQPIQNFQLDRYLGKWYEIARLDHSFERGLDNVSANYSLRQDGGIDVLNKGFNKNSGVWKEAKGRGYFLGEKNVGSLKVTFFWPFYGGYHVIVLADDYSYAMVCGPNRSYLWILARDRKLAAETTATLVNTAKQLGFAVEQLIFVEHDRSE